LISINEKTTRKEWQAKSPITLMRCNYLAVCGRWNRGDVLCKDSNEDDEWDIGDERND